MNDRVHGLDEPLTADLAALDAALGRLASEDAARNPAGLEDRIFVASRAAITPLPRDIAPVGARVDRLASADKAAGGPGLEDGAFELSREAVTSGRFADPAVIVAGTALGIVGEGETPRVRVCKGSPWRAFGVAAAVVLAGGAVAVWQVGRGTPAPDQSVAVNRSQAQSADQLAEKISDEMDVLFEIIGTDHTVSSADALDADQDHDTAWIDNLFDKESL